MPSVKSLLVRARISLAEAAEARKLSCEEVRLELGEVAEGLAKLSAPARRHVRGCDRCRTFSKQLKDNNHALAAVLPVGALLMLKKLLLAKLGSPPRPAARTSPAAPARRSCGAGAARRRQPRAAAGAGARRRRLHAGAGAIADKAVAGLAAAAIVTAGAVAADQPAHPRRHHTHAATRAASRPVAVAPQSSRASTGQPSARAAAGDRRRRRPPRHAPPRRPSRRGSAPTRRRDAQARASPAPGEAAEASRPAAGGPPTSRRADPRPPRRPACPRPSAPATPPAAEDAAEPTHRRVRPRRDAATAATAAAVAAKSRTPSDRRSAAAGKRAGRATALDTAPYDGTSRRPLGLRRHRRSEAPEKPAEPIRPRVLSPA